MSHNDEVEKTFWEPGEYVDVKDSVGKWCQGLVVAYDAKKKAALVHYIGWSERWNEWVMYKDQRFAPFRMFSPNNVGPQRNTTSYKLFDDPNDARYQAFTKFLKFSGQFFVGLKGYEAHLKQVAEVVKARAEGKQAKYKWEALPVPDFGDKKKKGDEGDGEAAMEEEPKDLGEEKDGYVSFKKAHPEWWKMFFTHSRPPKEDNRNPSLKTVPDYIHVVLNAVIYKPRNVPEVVKFLRGNVLLCYLQLKYERDLPSLYADRVMQLFEAVDSIFFSKYGNSVEAKNIKGAWAVRPPPRGQGDDLHVISAFIIQLINYFGEIGGWDVLLERVQSEQFLSDRDNLYVFQRWFAVLAHCRRYFVHKWAKPYIAKFLFAERCIAKMPNFSDKRMKDTPKEMFHDLIVVCQELFKYAHLPNSKSNETPKAVPVGKEQLAPFEKLAKASKRDRISSFTIRQAYMAEMTNRLRAVIALRQLRTDALSVKLAGIDNLNIVRLNAINMESGKMEDRRPFREISWVWYPNFFKWCEEEKVLDLLVYKSVHEQVLTQGVLVLKYLAQHDRLPPKYVDLIWDAGVGKPENLQRTTYNVLAALAATLSDQHLNTLFNRIMKVPHDSYKDFFLSFLKQFTENAHREEKKKGEGDKDKEGGDSTSSSSSSSNRKEFAFDLFWELITDESTSVVEEIVECAHSNMNKLLASHKFARRRVEFFDRCFNGIRKDVSALPCIRILQNMISIFQAQRRNPREMTRNQVILKLQSERSILDVLFFDLERYMKKARAEFQRLHPDASLPYDGKNGDSQAMFDTRFLHKQQLQRRLSLLEFVLKNSEVAMSFDQVKRVWSAFFTNAATVSDSGVLLKWLDRVTDKQGDRGARSYGCFQNLVEQQIFTDLLCDPHYTDHKSLSKDGYKTFETFFFLINRINENLLFVHHTNEWSVTSYERLVGMDALWHIATTALSKAVAQSASGALISLYLRYHDSMSHQARDILGTFVRRCMRTFSSGVDSLSKFDDGGKGGEGEGEDNSKQEEEEEAKKGGGDGGGEGEYEPQSRKETARVIRRSLEVMRSFLTECSTRVKMTSTDTSSASGQQFDGVADFSEPGGAMRTHNKQLAEAHIKLYKFPEQLLSDDKDYFEMFFRGMRAGGAVGTFVWEFLVSLPTHSPIQEQLNVISECKLEGQKTIAWDELLSSFDILRLFYVLRIVSDFLDSSALPLGVKPKDESAQDRQQREIQQQRIDAFVQRFVLLGGFAHLFNIAANKISIEQVNSGILQRTCFASLLRVLAVILVNKQKVKKVNEAVAEVLDAPLATGMVKKLVQLIGQSLDASSIEEKLVTKAAGETASSAASSASAGTQTDTGGASYGPALPPNMQGGVSNGMEVVGTAVGKGSDGKSSGGGKNEAVVVNPCAECIAQSFAVIDVMLSHYPESVSSLFCESGLWETVIKEGISEQKNLEIRRGVSRGVTAFVKNESLIKAAKESNDKTVVEQQPPAYFLKIFLSMHNKSTELSVGSRQFYECLCRLLLNAPKGSGDQADTSTATIYDANALLQASLEELQLEKSMEKDHLNVNERLIGLLHVVRDVLVSNPHLRVKFGAQLDLSSSFVKHAKEIEERESRVVLHAQPEKKGDDGKPDVYYTTGIGLEFPRKADDSQAELSGIELICRMIFDCPTSSYYRRSGTVPPPHCKSARSRAAAYHLLNEFCARSVQNQARLLSILTSLHRETHNRGKKPLDFDYDTRNESKSSTGYVGIWNLGCICYMNSLLQQFFMIPQVRQNVYKIEPGLLIKQDLRKRMLWKEAGRKLKMREHIVYKLSDFLVYQLQYMMVYLRETEKMYYYPLPFCHSFVDSRGQSVDLITQEDSGEFLRKLVNKVNEFIRPTPWRYTFAQSLRGIMADQMLGKCGHLKERDEESWFIPVVVKNKRSLHESLREYVSGQVINGYRCDSCKGKVDTRKRSVIRHAPPTLTFVLKRFEMNYRTLQTVKINDRLEFPAVLDMYPYTRQCWVETGMLGDASLLALDAAEKHKDKTKERREREEKEYNARKKAAEEAGVEFDEVMDPIMPRDYFQYVLRGIVIHQGTADRGHYFSYIAKRDDDQDVDDDSSEQQKLENESKTGEHKPLEIDPDTDWALKSSWSSSMAADVKWFEFNDQRVSKFDVGQVPNVAFGGSYQVNNYSRTDTFQKEANGYLLFYDRIRKFPQDYGPPVSKRKVAKSAAKKTKKKKKKKPEEDDEEYQSIVTKINELENSHRSHKELIREVWAENVTYFKDRYTFDSTYWDFLWKLVQKRDRVKGKPDKDMLAANSQLRAFLEGESDASKLLFLALPSVKTSGVCMPSPADPCFDALKFAVQLVLKTIVRARNKERPLQRWRDFVGNALHRHTPFAAWFLDLFTQNPDLIVELCIVCSQTPVRGAVVRMLRAALGSVSKHERQTFSTALKYTGVDESDVKEGGEGGEGEAKCPRNWLLTPPRAMHDWTMKIAKAKAYKGRRTLPKDAPDEKSAEAKEGGAQEEEGGSEQGQSQSQSQTPENLQIQKVSFSTDFIDMYLRFLPFVGPFWRNFTEYFQLLKNFAEQGHDEVRFLLQRNVLARVVDVFLGQDSPLPAVNGQTEEEGKSRPVLRSGQTTPDWNSVLTLLRVLVNSSRRSGGVGTASDRPQTARFDYKDLEPLSEEAILLLDSEEFVQKIVQEATTRFRGYDVSAILWHLAHNSPQYSQLMIDVCLAGIRENVYEYVRPYFRVLCSLMEIGDSLVSDRVEWICSGLCQLLRRQKMYWMATDFVCEHLLRLAKKSAAVASWLVEHKQEWSWIQEWYRKHPHHSRLPDKMQRFKPEGGKTLGYNTVLPHVSMTVNRKLAMLQLLANSQDGRPHIVDVDDGSDSDIDHERRRFRVGQWIEVRDSQNNWLKAQVIDLRTVKTDKGYNRSEVQVRCYAWRDSWTSWVPCNSHNLGRFGKFTDGVFLKSNLNKGDKGDKGDKGGKKEGNGQGGNQNQPTSANNGGGGGGGLAPMDVVGEGNQQFPKEGERPPEA